MSARTFIYQTLAQTPGITDHVGGAINPRIFAKKTMTSSIENTPYIVYKLGNETVELANEQFEASRQFFQVWVHDFMDTVTADYAKIDEVILAIRAAFWLKNSASENIWTTEWVETSQDLDDDTLQTVFKYVRFQLVRRSQ